MRVTHGVSEPSWLDLLLFIDGQREELGRVWGHGTDKVGWAQAHARRLVLNSSRSTSCGKTHSLDDYESDRFDGI